MPVTGLPAAVEYIFQDGGKIVSYKIFGNERGATTVVLRFEPVRHVAVDNTTRISLSSPPVPLPRKAPSKLKRDKLRMNQFANRQNNNVSPHSATSVQTPTSPDDCSNFSLDDKAATPSSPLSQSSQSPHEDSGLAQSPAYGASYQYQINDSTQIVYQNTNPPCQPNTVSENIKRKEDNLGQIVCQSPPVQSNIDDTNLSINTAHQTTHFVNEQSRRHSISNEETLTFNSFETSNKTNSESSMPSDPDPKQQQTFIDHRKIETYKNDSHFMDNMKKLYQQSGPLISWIKHVVSHPSDDDLLFVGTGHFSLAYSISQNEYIHLFQSSCPSTAFEIFINETMNAEPREWVERDIFLEMNNTVLQLYTELNNICGSN